MGNYMSCSLASPAAALLSQGPKVILPTGVVYYAGAASATAAELMLDHPGHFLVHSGAILVNRRLSALSADEELELGALYAMFPMERLGSSATAADAGRLLLASGKQARRARAQVMPDAEPSGHVFPAEAENRLVLPEVDDVLFGEFRYKRSLCRSKRPVLETIKEEAIC